MVLAKGLIFVPTTNISKNQIQRDFKRTERSFRLSYFFLENSNIKIKNHPFKDKSKFSVPNYTDNQIEKYIFYMKMELSNYRPQKKQYNFTYQERRHLNDLKRDEKNHHPQSR